jgi:hypothetical protein
MSLPILLTSPPASPVYPLKTLPGRHYMVDQAGVPFFVQGDSPWYITEALSQADADFYLSNRWAQGFNSIILDIAASHITDMFPNDANYYSQYPFTNTLAGQYTNLLSYNASYFTNVDWVIQRAAHYGICVFAYPLYDDYNGVAWYAQMTGNPTSALYQYGQFIGNRYQNFKNLVWIGAGDYTEPNLPTNNLWKWVAAGIMSADPIHLISAQAKRTTPAIIYSNFVSVNSSYPNQYTYIYSQSNYQRVPVMASFMREAYYEHSTTFPTAMNCRQEAYWAVFSGDMGHFYGDDNQWEFNSGWRAEMWDAGATTITNVFKLMNSRMWWNFVPDFNHQVVVSGYGTNGTVDYITSTREASGKTIMLYIPQDQLSPTVNLASVSGSTANAWWYNPSTGTATAIGSYLCRGTQTFAPPDTNDWVLVLDDAAQNYPPPGVGGPLASALILQPGTASGFELRLEGAPDQTFTIQFATNLTSSWLTLTEATTDDSGWLSVEITPAANAGFYRAALP